MGCNMDRQRNGQRLGLFAVVSIVLLATLVCSVLIVDSLVYPDIPESSYERKTLTVNNVSYFPRQDIRVYLVMGIDREGLVVDSGSYKNPGAADVLLVIVFDDTAREYSVIALNRDTMVEMPILGLGGKNAGSITAQLALSHTYGNGLHQSCINTRDTVSELLYGTTIHQYFSMNMDVISILTDAVGGVKVNVTDDFSAIDGTILPGEMVLNGEQAYMFVRTRKDVGDQLNISRMNRHEEFMHGFIDAFHDNIGNDATKVMEIYEKIAPYMVTDCSEHMMTDLLNRFYNYEFAGVISPAGTNVRGEEYMEFYLDEEKLFQLVISLLYEPKE